MNLLVKIAVAALFFVVGSYYLYFYITPSVTVINESESVITAASVSLPQSNLNFGSIDLGQESTIYYSLSQSDGSYNYSFNISSKIINGSCGYITINELNKRFVITVSKSKLVVCSQ